MFGKDRTVEVELLLKNKSFEAGLDKSESKLGNFGKTVGKFGGIAKAGFAVAAAAVVVMSVKGVAAASSLQETVSKFKTVFSEVEEEATAMAQNLVDNFGVSERASYDLLSSTGDLLAGFGFAQDQALSLSNEIAQLGADMASFQNIQGGAEEASQRITAALLGETEGMKALGVKISQGTKEFKEHVTAVQSATGATEAQAKALVIMEEIAKQSGNSIGDLARTADSYANVQRRVAARLENISTNFGGNLLQPLSELGATFLEVSKDGSAFAEILGWISEKVAEAIKFINEMLKKVASLAEEKKFDIYEKSLESQEKLTAKISEMENSTIPRLKKSLQEALDSGGDPIDAEQKKLQLQTAETNLQRYYARWSQLAKKNQDTRKKYLSNIPAEVKRIDDQILDLQGKKYDTSSQIAELESRKQKLLLDQSLADEKDALISQADFQQSQSARTRDQVLANIKNLQTNFKASEESKTDATKNESKKRVTAEAQALAAIENDTTSWQAQYRDSWIMMSEQIEEANKTMADNIRRQYPPLLKALDDFVDISTAKWGDYFQGIITATGELTSAISDYYQQLTDNRIASLESQYEQENEKYEEQLELNEERKTEELEKLNEDLQAELAAKGLADQTELQQAQAKLAEIQKKIDAETDAEKKADLQEQLSAQKKAVEKLKIEEEYAEKSAQIEAERAAEQARIEEEQAKYEAEMEAKKARIEKENFERQKKISILNASIAAAEGAIQAYKALAGIPIVGPGLGAAAAAAILTFRTQQIAEMNKQKYVAEKGLIVPGTSYTGDNINVGVNSGEMILTREQQQELFNIAKGNTQGAVQPGASPESNMFNLYIDLGYETITRQVQTGIDSRDIYITADNIAKG